MTVARTTVRAGLAAVLASSVALPAIAQSNGNVNVYSARHYDTDQQLYETFEERTGINVNVLEAGSDQLIERIEREGVNTPADVLITVDAGRVWRAEEAGILAETESEVLQERLPDAMRASDGRWFGFSKRMRLVFYNKDNASSDVIDSYEDLARDDLAADICVRSSNNIYNQSLVASLLHYHGADWTENWVEGLVANMAREPQGGDTAQLMAAAAGQCDLAIANHYYYLRMLEADDDELVEQAEQLGVIFPNSQGRGVHVNVGAAGRIENGPNPDNATRFLEYLSSDSAQENFAKGNMEYPVVDGVDKAEPLQRWGEINQDDLNVGILGRNNPEAVKIMDRGGWR